MEVLSSAALMATLTLALLLQPIIEQMRSVLGDEKGKIYWDVLRRCCPVGAGRRASPNRAP
jgi:hypothetical protein